MNNILDEYTAGNPVSPEIKDRLMSSARLYLLVRDMGELFTQALGETGRDLIVQQVVSKDSE